MTGCPECGNEDELLDASVAGDKICPECGMLWRNLENLDEEHENKVQNGDDGGQ